MAYKKYIKRNGKVYGPYLYNSKRVNGKVVTEYCGHKKESENIFRRKNIFVVISLFLLSMFLVFFVMDSNLTGRSIVNIKSERVGDTIVGDLELTVYGGELIPSDADVVITNENMTYTYSLSDVFGDEKISGDYYLKGSDIQGSGDGYGLVGEREIFPEITFDIELTTIPEDENDTSSVDVVSFNIKKGEDVTYSLDGYSDYSITNVEDDSGELDDSVLDVSESDGYLSITTDYSVIEEGFGNDYVTDFKKTYSVDISSLGIDLVSGDLSFDMSFEGETLVDYNTVLESDIVENVTVPDENESLEENVSEGQDVPIEPENVSTDEDLPIDDDNESVISNDTVDEVIDMNITEVIVQKSVFDDISLTDDEKSVLKDSFGDVIVSSKAVDYRDRVIILFELGDYSFGGSYDARLNDSEIMKVMKRDRILWLKDLSRELSSSLYIEKDRDSFNEFYSVD